MARILSFSRPAADRKPAVLSEGKAGHVVAMQHIDLDAVVETVRVLRALDRHALLDEFNGCGHAARQIERQ